MGSGNLEVFKFALYVFIPIGIMAFSDLPIFHKEVEELQHKRDLQLTPGFVPNDKEELKEALEKVKSKAKLY